MRKSAVSVNGPLVAGEKGMSSVKNSTSPLTAEGARKRIASNDSSGHSELLIPLSFPFSNPINDLISLLKKYNLRNYYFFNDYQSLPRVLKIII